MPNALSTKVQSALIIYVALWAAPSSSTPGIRQTQLQHPQRCGLCSHSSLSESRNTAADSAVPDGPSSWAAAGCLTAAAWGDCTAGVSGSKAPGLADLTEAGYNDALREEWWAAAPKAHGPSFLAELLALAVSSALPDDIWQKIAWVWGTMLTACHLAHACGLLPV